MSQSIAAVPPSTVVPLAIVRPGGASQAPTHDARAGGGTLGAAVGPGR